MAPCYIQCAWRAEARPEYDAKAERANTDQDKQMSYIFGACVVLKTLGISEEFIYLSRSQKAVTLSSS